jgi:hypothetical protein
MQYKWDEDGKDFVDVPFLKYGLRKWVGMPWWKLKILNNSRRVMLRLLTGGNGKNRSCTPLTLCRMKHFEDQ